MSEMLLYPLRFEPIYQYRLWGGRRLADLLAAPLPGAGPIGEAWVLSDRYDYRSQVANGPLKGRTIGQLLEQSPEQLLGKLAQRFRRFPVPSVNVIRRETRAFDGLIESANRPGTEGL
jgi:mannose-6-phosphate isomerase